MFKKIILSIIALSLIFVIPQAFADNSLQDTSLHAESGVITLDIEFGYDNFRQLLYKTITTPTINNITMTFYGDEIDMSDSYLKVYGDGRLFSIKNIEKGIVMYAKQNLELDNYTINIYFATHKGLQKFIVTSDISLPEEKTIQTQEPEKKQQYIPKLLMTSSHDFSTYWKDTFNIDVQAYDGNINPSATGFEGRLNGVDVTVIITKNDETLTTLKGITEHGEWSGDHYIKENLIQAGEYVVNVITSLDDQSLSKTSSMFVIGTVSSSGGSSNHTPIAIATADNTTLTHPDTVSLDGTSSSDSDGDVLTYLWNIQSGLGSLSNENTSTPTYTTVGTTTAIIQLTVTDPKGKSSTDTVTITVS